MAQPSPGGDSVPVARAPARILTVANLASASRIPLAAVFLYVDGPMPRLLILALAALTDLLDGWLARRHGTTTLGALVDPVADKLFMLAAFLALAFSRALHPLEVLGVMLRDVLASGGYAARLLGGRPLVIPARVGGKAVTVAQNLTLAAWLLGSNLLRPLAWATAAMALYAVADYGRAAVRQAERKDR